MQVINCFKEDNPVINKKLKEVSIDEGLDIAKNLFNVLNERKDGIGLAANQVGIDARVAVVNVREPIILINPKIIKAWDEIPYYEGCLSYPKKGVQTERYKNIIIKTEQEESDWYASLSEQSKELIAKGIKDVEDGNFIPQAEVQSQADQLLGRVRTVS
mgnify:CR=1 FL=1